MASGGPSGTADQADFMAVEAAAADDNLAKLLGLSNMTGVCGCVDGCTAVTRVAWPFYHLQCTLDLINNKGILVFLLFFN